MSQVLIPLDVIRYIVSYNTDIDVRRSFGVYRKIDIKPYEFMKSVFIRSIHEEGSNVTYGMENTVVRYNLYNSVEMPQREKEGIQDDAIQVYITELPYTSYLLIEIDIYKLKRRTGIKENAKKESECNMPLGSLKREYYWDCFLYSYTRIM